MNFVEIGEICIIDLGGWVPLKRDDHNLLAEAG